MTTAIVFEPFDAIPLTEPPRLLTALEFDDLRKRIHDAQGDIRSIGITPTQIRDMVWTQRNLEKPVKVEGPKEPKGKKTTTTGVDLEGFLS